MDHRTEQPNNPPEVRFLRLLAQRLHEFGTAAHRLEGAVGAAAERMGLRCDMFSTPTSVLMAFRYPQTAEEDTPQLATQLIRLKPGDVDLGRLAAADAIAEQVANGELGIDHGLERLRELQYQIPPFGLIGSVFAWGLTGISVAALLGSAWLDLAIAFPLGLVTGMFALRWGRGWQEVGSFEAILAFLVTAIAYLAASLVGGANVANIVVGALIVLMPGLGLTVAITELSTGHWVAGSARFAGAIVILAKLALGVVVASQLMQSLELTSIGSLSAAPPPWFKWLALVAAGVAFAILFAAQLRDYLAVITAAFVSFAVNVLATAEFGPELGVFLAALVVAGLSNVYGRWCNRPASIVRFPGIILLVPGSLGYRAISLVFSRNLDDGLEAALAVAMVLASLVGGLLIGNTLVPPRRNL